MKQFSTEKRKVLNNEYLKVFLLDEKRNDEVQLVLSKLDCVKNVNLTPSTSANNPKVTLTVYPKRMFDIDTLEKHVIRFLDNYFDGIVDNSTAVENEAHFIGIQDKILNTLEEARVSILLAMSWFTNVVLLEKLVQKQNAGVDVKVVIFEDGINGKYGVDLTQLNAVRKIKGNRGGVMHDKFCVIDNQVVITGSYNWTVNAETRNDENVTIQRDPKSATDYSVKFNELYNNL